MRWETFGPAGAIRLYYGDGRDLLPSVAADPLRTVLITDPPYGKALENHDKGGRRSDREFTVEGDANQALGIELCRWAESLGIPAVVFADIMLPWPGKWRQYLVWDKGPAVGGGGDTGKCWKQTAEIIQIARTGVLSGKRDEAVLHFHVVPADSVLHPCQKPTKLLRYLIEKVCRAGDTVLDPFVGSGSSAVAAAQCGMAFIGAEIDDKHFATACRRIEKEFDRPLLGF